MPEKQKASYFLIILVFSQFAGTSLWFAGNAIIDQITKGADHAGITSYVQFGFIAGTLIFSLLTIADRFCSKYVFFFSAILAASANLCIIWLSHNAFALAFLRFLTGFFLAGIYPVGMKIAADVFPEKIGKALGFLVGALVLGTSFPHFVRSQLSSIHWETVILTTSLLAMAGGWIVLLLIPQKKKSAIHKKIDFTAAFYVFQAKPFRAAAFGYFGHMWELYAFWSILPLLFTYHNSLHQKESNVYWWSFLVIATGSLGCAVGGLVSQKWGSQKVASTSLLLSGICCLLSPFFFSASPFPFYTLMVCWGFTVTADSPQFSALVAQAAEEKHKGTALTIVTSIGFAITIISILLLKDLFITKKALALWLLAPGPLFGLLALKIIK